MFYKNQFILCNKLPLNIINKFNLNVLEINSERYLYYNKLNIQIFNKDVERVILIGFCLQSDPDKKQEIKDIFDTKIDDIEVILSTLVGNYIVIYKDMIYKDIGNLFKLFLYENNDEVIISNNALVFKNILNLDLGIHNKFGGHKFKYCPPGKSCFSKVKTLYNSQYVNINGEIFHNQLTKNKIINNNLTINNFVEMHSQYCCQIINNLYNFLKVKNKKLFITLTGGRDSRMILAVCLYLKIPFEVITLELNKDDVNIAKIICEKFNLKYHLIDFNKFKINNNKKKEWENIIGDEFDERDNEIIQKQVLKNIMNDDDCIIFGNGPKWASRTNDARATDNIKCKQYSEYKKWIENYPNKNIPLINRKFLEIRVGSWLSSIQNSYDMCSTIQRFCFPISEKIIANSFLFNSKRNKIIINQGVIDLLCPELNKIKYQ